jgi:crotonobetainyl-CoA:carnitine CoA-transferase CaiB-like acyl-CoA transferase
MGRAGNRSPLAAPQGLYPCAGGQPGAEHWLAISVVSDAHWRALRAAMDEPDWAQTAAFDTHEGRAAAQDALDERLRAWTRSHERGSLETLLRTHGVPASAVADPCRLLETNPQLVSRGFFEALEHPVVGPMPLPTAPARTERITRWLRTPAPTMGRDNAEVLGGLLGLGDGELAELEREGVIGTRPDGL